MEPAESVRDHPLWPWVKQLQASRGRDLVQRHHAHGLDIDWVEHPDGQVVPGLVFHVSSDHVADAAAIPTIIEVADADGRTRRIRTRVEVSPPAEFE